MSGFSTEERRSAWWSTDTRRAYQGKGMEVVLEKIGKAERPDLSGIEEVQMGLKMQDTIAKFASEELNIPVRPLDDAVATHRVHGWLKSHGDYIVDMNTALVECKNYNAAHIHHYSEPGDPVRVPAGDWAQCCHEAACFGVSTVYLAVLFGGQRFRMFRLDFTEEEKDALIQRMAKLWAHVQAGTMPEPETVEQCRVAFPVTVGKVAVADANLEAAAKRLAGIKASIKSFEAEEDRLATALMRATGDAEELQTIDGRTLLTWKQAKGSRRFSAELLKQAYPDIYESFCVETAGSRRFLLKEKAE